MPFRLYAIRITEKNLDLLEYLNDGVRPGIEEKPTYFILDTTETRRDMRNTIMFEDDLYDTKGHCIFENMTFLM